MFNGSTTSRLSEGVESISDSTGSRFLERDVALRLFITCWLVYTLHFATNIVREHYLALAIGDNFSFRVDEYAGLHDDIFETTEYGWHIGSNPGVSMLAAIPYATFRPLINQIVERVQHRRQLDGQTEPPSYNTPVSVDREFFREAWDRGFDVKLALAAFVMQSMCMAPSSALATVLMYYLLLAVVGSKTKALGLALLYGFGTPVFFRTGFLNHNLMLGHIAFAGFVAMWNPFGSKRWTNNIRFFLAGIAGGTALLFDYSGAVMLLVLACYGMAKQWQNSKKEAVVGSLWYVIGSLGPIGVLWFYQWQSFGHPFLPPQNWMPAVEWSDQGYQGFTWPQPELLLALATDYRYGLFTSSPLLLLAFLAPFVSRNGKPHLPRLELIFVFAAFAALWLFFSGVHYTRWQFNTGVRYMAPILPLLFLPVAVVLTRLPRTLAYIIAVLSVAHSWCLAMARDVAAGQINLTDMESGRGVLEPVLLVFLGGFRLPALTTLSRMADEFGNYFVNGPSPIPLFALAAALTIAIWLPWRHTPA
jgi:hypothetical protein